MRDIEKLVSAAKQGYEALTALCTTDARYPSGLDFQATQKQTAFIDYGGLGFEAWRALADALKPYENDDSTNDSA